MSDLTILEMIAGLRAQKEKIDRALAALEPLAGLQGESQWAGEVPKRTSVRKSKAPVERAKKRTSERTQGVAQEHVKTKSKKGKTLPGLDPYKPNSARALGLKVLTEADRPIDGAEFLKRMLAAGWATKGNPDNNAQQILYQLVQKRLVQRHGVKPRFTYGRPGQKPQEPELFDTVPSTHMSGRELAIEVIAAAKQPLNTREVVTRMQARGWSTDGNAVNVVKAALRTAAEKGQTKRYGQGIHGTWGLPGWGNAVKAMRAVQKTNGAVQEG